MAQGNSETPSVVLSKSPGERKRRDRRLARALTQNQEGGAAYANGNTIKLDESVAPAAQLEASLETSPGQSLNSGHL